MGAPLDVFGIDIARYYPFQRTEYIQARCYETAFKIYNPPSTTVSRTPPRVAFVRARSTSAKSVRWVFHGSCRLGARSRLREQRTPIGKVR